MNPLRPQPCAVAGGGGEELPARDLNAIVLAHAGNGNADAAAVSARLLLTEILRRGEPVGRGPVVRRIVADIVEGLRYVRRHPLIGLLTLAGFGQSLTNGAVFGLMVVYGCVNWVWPPLMRGLAGCSPRARWVG